MTLIQRLVREPALLIGVITAFFGVLVVFGVDLTKDQIGSITVFVGILMALVRYLTTPAKEVVAQLKPGAVLPIAGPAAEVPDGVKVDVDLTPVNENGQITLEVVFYFLGMIFFVVGTLWLLGAETRNLFG